MLKWLTKSERDLIEKLRNCKTAHVFLVESEVPIQEPTYEQKIDFCQAGLDLLSAHLKHQDGVSVTYLLLS